MAAEAPPDVREGDVEPPRSELTEMVRLPPLSTRLFEAAEPRFTVRLPLVRLPLAILLRPVAGRPVEMPPPLVRAAGR